MKKLVGIFLLISSVGLTSCAQNQTYEQMLADLYKNTVPFIKGHELESKLGKQEMLILDTREKDEYNVSHIKGAKLISYDNFELSDIPKVNKNTLIVIYCSVGYRSERIGEKLKKAGYTNVYNLYGGLFQWINEGRQVVGNDNKPTDKIHPYSDSWGKWLTRGKKVYKP